MKIISWNVNGLRACHKKGFLSFLKSENPDILAVQETKAHIQQVDSLLQNQSPYHLAWSISDIRGYSGTATYSKIKPQNISYKMGLSKFDREGRFTISYYKDFILFNIYFPNGALTQTRHFFKQEFLKRLNEYLEILLKKEKNIIIVGDYNVAYLDIDVFDPQSLSSTSGFLPEERKWFRDFLSLGFIDVYRHFYPKKRDSYTWWSYRENARKHNRGWRIDHICVSTSLKDRLKKVQILSNETGSDHCPILAELS